MGSFVAACGWSGLVVTGLLGLAVWTLVCGQSMLAERLGKLAMPGGWKGCKTCASTGGIVAILEWAKEELGAGGAWMCQGLVR